MKSHRLSHDTIITGVVLIIAAAALTLDSWVYFQIRNYITAQLTRPTTEIQSTADWQTYTNDQYGFNIKYPSNWVAKEIPNQEYDGVINFFQSETKTYPEQGGSQPIGKNLVTLSLLKNPDDLTLQQIFNNNYNKCLQEPNNDLGCPRPQNTESWQTITVDGAKAWRTGDIGIPEGPGANTLYIKQDGYYIEMTLMFFEPARKNIDTAILDRMISTFRFTDDISDWQTYTNDTYGYTISYPSNKYISPRSIDTNAIKIQNYNPSPDTFLLSEDEYYIEIDAGRSDCSDNPEWQPTKFGTRNGFVNDKEHADWREAGGRYITACIPGHQQAIFIMITSGDSTFTLQKKILSTFRFVDDISDWQTYTNSQLGFSIKHPAGWKIDDTTTPNKVWFNPRETEAVDSIEVSTKTRNEWLSGFYEDEIVEQRNLVVDGYPAVQIDLDAFGLQETGIFKDGKLYTIVSNQQIKELNILSTFRFTDDVSDSQMYTDTSPLCTAKPVSTEIGSEIYPSDTKYQKLTFLGPIFTAYKCSSSRLNAVLGNSNGQYTLGSTVWLKTAPSQQLITTLKAVGYLCSEKVSDASCKKWRLVKFVNVTDIMKLEPFSGQLQADDCVFCG